MNETESEIQAFKDIFAGNGVEINLSAFLLNLLLAAVVSYLLGKLYVRYGNNLSNRSQFSKNFVILTMATMIIITIVKSSLALSLGLVGALSIIRFRSAIKEPEELLYLFMSIAIGLGFGANHMILTVVSFVIVGVFIILTSSKTQKKTPRQNIHLVVYSKHPENVQLEKVIFELEKACKSVNLKRFDESEAFIEASFLIEFVSFETFNTVKEALRLMDSTMKISILNSEENAV